MSFTIMRFKDGLPSPLKLSIWDAFKGAPEPKPAKPQVVSATAPLTIEVNPAPIFIESLPEQPQEQTLECSCCHKVHPLSQGSAKNSGKTGKNNSKNVSKTGGNSATDEAKEDKEGNSFSNKDQETYSEEDNKVIIEMKGNNTPWKEILAAINKTSKSQLEAHWKTINPAKAKDKDETKATNDADKKGDNQNAKKQKQDENRKGEPGKGKSQKQNSKNDKIEIGELKSWSDRYDKQKWIAAASRHFDLTGQRITPAVAKQLAGSK